MRTALVIAALQIRRMVKNPGLLLVLLAIPLTLAVIEYAAFGRTAAAGKLPPIRVLFLDEDDTFSSQAVPQFLVGGELKDQFELANVESLEEAKSYFRRGEASAVIHVEKGFQDALFDGKEVTIRVYRNPSQTFSPDIVESVMEIGAVIGNGLYLRAKAPLAQIGTLVDEDREPTTEEVAAIAVGFFLAGKRLGKLEGLEDMDVKVQRADSEKAESAGRGAKPGEFFGMVFPGLTLFSLLFVSQALVFRLLRDRVRGLHRRLLAATGTPLAILTGGVLYLVVGLVVVLLFLALIGSAIFRIELREPLALLVLGVGFAIFAAGLLLAIGAASRDDKGAAAISGVVIIVLALLGGSFVPIEAIPDFLQKVATALPNGAAQHSMVQVLVHDKTFSDVTGGAMVVWTWALGTLALAMMLEARKLTR